MKNILSVLITSLTAVAFFPAIANEKPPTKTLSKDYQHYSYSPYVKPKHATRPLWGDTHVHTNLSTDAGLASNRLPPEMAYRFARGEEVTSSLGIPAKLSKPLDWLVIADHTDGMGLIGDILKSDPEIMGFEQVQGWNRALVEGGEVAAQAKVDLVKTFSAGKVDPKLMALYAPGSTKYQSLWQKAVADAEAFNEPGRFSTLIGYEWTSLINGNNMHRVVIMRDGSKRALQFEPFTMTPPTGSPDPRDLWKYMDKYEKVTGGKILAIPHNGNISNGIMFPLDAQWNGRKFDKSYAKQRARLEPLYEVTQIKGDSEAHPFLSPGDEFADFETWDKSNLAATELKTKDMLAGEYAREALKRGLAIEERLGTNPYKFGLIGSTDTHTSLATAEENNFFGKNSTDEPTGIERGKIRLKKIGDGALMNWETSASGLTAVWAADNSREAIFDAMQRKEVYASTGPRITLRVFGGWDFDNKDLNAQSFASIGYEKGVPMGGDFTKKPRAAKSPKLMIAAMRDPIGANLDRIQVVKGWVDHDGKTQEQIYNVTWSGERAIDKNGKLPAVGNTVNVADATWSNTIGESELSTVWTDPDFDKKLNAFYYVRVLEIPTPRWTTYDAHRFGIEIPKGAPTTIQERAYSSPIWYQPN
ncbi:MAG: DUF3604 domain-containing protein [Colwellia sp.]|nr:DUF3604 domain-containing protein [Colwellia sp.]MCW8863894.1 DUF3604 domain-containing protein [Colwellia sp.]MCW9081176.1 DUF3604 domain-containing protein [Colwellia sp.]